MATEEVIFDDSPMARYLQELEQENTVQNNAITSASLNDEITKAWNELTAPEEKDHQVKNQELVQKIDCGEKHSEDPKLIFFKYLEPELYEGLNSQERVKTQKYADLILNSSFIESDKLESGSSSDTHLNPAPTFNSGAYQSYNISHHTVKNIAALFILLVLMIKGVLPSMAFLFFVYFSVALYARYRIRVLQKESQADHIHNLRRIEEFIDESIKFDKLVKKVIITIAEVELVSRGYKLSYPLSPITRLEQNAKQRKCQMLRKQLAQSLLRLDLEYKNVVESLNDAELETVNEDSNSLAYLKHIRSRVHTMRTHFLETFVNVCQHEPLRARDFLIHMTRISSSLKEERIEIDKALQKELYISNELNLPQVKKHKETLENQFVLSINNLQTQLQSVIARINLCKQDLSLYNMESQTEGADNTRSNTELQNEMNELLKHFSRIKSDLEESIKNWESSNGLLIKFIDKMNKDRDPKQRDAQQIPATSAELEYEPTIVALERSSENEHEQVEKVYEGDTGGEAEEDETERRIKSREERIIEMKQRREQQAQRQAAMLEKLAIIQELKGVLEVRAQAKTSK